MIRLMLVLVLAITTGAQSARALAPSWEQTTFATPYWKPAVTEGNGPCTDPWYCSFGNDPGLGPDARWIWSYDSRGDWWAGWQEVFFRATFVAESDRYRLWITADNEYYVFVDGQYLGGGYDWQQVAAIEMALEPDVEHVIEVAVYNWGGPGGLLVDLQSVGEPPAPRPLDLVPAAPLQVVRMLAEEPLCQALPGPQAVLAEYQASLERADWLAATAALDRFQRLLSCATTEATLTLTRQFADAIAVAARRVNAAGADMLPSECRTFNALLNPGLLVDDLVACQGGLEFYEQLRDGTVRYAGKTCAAYYPSNQLGLWGYDLFKGTLVGSSLLTSAVDGSVTSVIDAFWARFPEPLNRGFCCSLPEMLADGFVCGRGVASCGPDALSGASAPGAPNAGPATSLAADLSMHPATRAFGTSPEAIVANYCRFRQGRDGGDSGNDGLGATALDSAQCLSSAVGGRRLTSATERLYDAAPGMRCVRDGGLRTSVADLLAGPTAGEQPQGVLDPRCPSPLDAGHGWSDDPALDSRKAVAREYALGGPWKVDVDDIKKWLMDQTDSTAEKMGILAAKVAVLPNEIAAAACSPDGKQSSACTLSPTAKDPSQVVVIPQSVANGGTYKDTNGKPRTGNEVVIHELNHAGQNAAGNTTHNTDPKEHKKLDDKSSKQAKDYADKKQQNQQTPAPSPTKQPGPEEPFGNLGCSAAANKIRAVATCLGDAFGVDAPAGVPKSVDPTPIIYPTDDSTTVSFSGCGSYAPPFVKMCSAVVRCSEGTTCCQQSTMRGNATTTSLWNANRDLCQVSDPPPPECSGGSSIPRIGTGPLPPPNPAVSPVGSLWDGTVVTSRDVVWTDAATFTLLEPTANLVAGTLVRVDGPSLQYFDDGRETWTTFGSAARP